MGARAQVKIQESERSAPVYLYTHWGSGEIIEDVKRALAKNWRWSDYEYLARVIFDEMKGDDFDTETGYGISTSEHGDNDILVEILPGQKIRVGELTLTFDQFIQLPNDGD